MKGRTPTASEKKWLDAICRIGCIVCYNQGTYTPFVTPHHIHGRSGAGAHFDTLPLCGPHHQVASPTGEWATRHGPGRRAGKVAFAEAYGTERELLDQVRRLVREQEMGS